MSDIDKTQAIILARRITINRLGVHRRAIQSLLRNNANFSIIPSILHSKLSAKQNKSGGGREGDIPAPYEVELVGGRSTLTPETLSWGKVSEFLLAKSFVIKMIMCADIDLLFS